MINEVMEHINNFFIKECEEATVTINAAAKTITIDADTFGQTYIEGQYIRIKNSLLNDSVYKVSSATDTVITVEEVLIDEVSVSICLQSLAPTKAFLSIVSDIENWTASNAGSEGISSIKLGDLSKNYVSPTDGTGGWTSAFRSRLNTYRKMRW